MAEAGATRLTALARTLTAADGNGATPLAAAFRAGREGLRLSVGWDASRWA
jgi:hypothetical protein